ncbi:hypothetical protein [Trichococcus flocculiformis]|uniref:hypothetical protein n=1 Tax=Trichococcus flocculiformis TaxID=82803 RepID=UPI003DA43222
MTEKSIVSANRPYVVFYIETLDTVYFEKYIVIKNFGKSAAKILDLTFISKLDEKNDLNRLRSLVGGIIAPNQKFTTSMDTNFNETITGKIKYQDLDGAIYEEEFKIKTDMCHQICYGKK